MRTFRLISITAALSVALLMPVFTFAANTGDLFEFFNLSTSALIGTNMTLAATLILTYFLIGVLKYVKSEGEAKKQGIAMITHGLIALFILVSMWAIVAIFANTFLMNPSLTPLTRP